MYVSFNRRSPVSALEIYQRLGRMAQNGILDVWARPTYSDYRQAFAYLEWYGRHIRSTSRRSNEVSMVEPPELDQTRVTRPDVTGTKLQKFIIEEGLDSYLWRGEQWDNYDPVSGTTFEGWQGTLQQRAIQFGEFQQAAPAQRIKSRWVAGAIE
jgi:hypothetical protein